MKEPFNKNSTNYTLGTHYLGFEFRDNSCFPHKRIIELTAWPIFQLKINEGKHRGVILDTRLRDKLMNYRFESKQLLEVPPRAICAHWLKWLQMFHQLEKFNKEFYRKNIREVIHFQFLFLIYHWKFELNIYIFSKLKKCIMLKSWCSVLL